MKPKPFSALNHFTVPSATCAPTFRACGRPPWTWGPGLALPPVEHERGTRTARDGTGRKACWTVDPRTAHTRLRGACAPRVTGHRNPTPLADEPRGPD